MTLPAPSGRDLVVVGASAGGVEALKTFVHGLPDHLPATVLVALHLPAGARSVLMQILQRRCSLQVVQAEEGLPLTPSQVVVAHPDAHLLVVDDRVRLGRGPREHGSRPSHDAMLRAAALARGPRVVAAVLTGLLDDGAAGMTVVHRYGGACLVEDPATAEFPSMPRAVLRAVPGARALPLSSLAAEVVRLVQQEPDPAPVVDRHQQLVDRAEADQALGRRPNLPPGTASSYAAPTAAPSREGCSCPTPPMPTSSSRRCSPTCGTAAGPTSPGTSGRA